MPIHAPIQNWSLYAHNGERKYLNPSETERVLACAAVLPVSQRLFILTMMCSGARISEALALTRRAFQPAECVVSIRTLKRRCFTVREVPLPRALIAALDGHFGLMPGDHRFPTDDDCLWAWHRVTAWRFIKQVMARAGVTGLRASPRGLRHAVGVAGLRANIPKEIRQKWLGHARPETTDIYSAICGPDEFAFAAALWDALLGANAFSAFAFGAASKV